MSFTSSLLQKLQMKLDMLCTLFIYFFYEDQTTQNSYHLLNSTNHSRLNLAQACSKQLSVYL